MSYQIINTSSTQSSTPFAPEYQSDNSRLCSGCSDRIDLDDDLFTEMADGDIRCDDCRESCLYCGEWITEYSTVKYEGSNPYHVECVEEE